MTYLTSEDFERRVAEGESPEDLYNEAQLFEITGTVVIRALGEAHARELMAKALLGDPVIGGSTFLGVIEEPTITVTGLEG